MNPPDPFSAQGRFEERRRDAEQQRALERSTYRSDAQREMDEIVRRELAEPEVDPAEGFGNLRLTLLGVALFWGLLGAGVYWANGWSVWDWAKDVF
jgi:hypothetical protein